MKWQRGLKLITAVILMLIGADKLIDILPNPILNYKAQQLQRLLSSGDIIMPFIGVFEILTGLALFFKRSTPLGALMFLPLSTTLAVFYLAFAPESSFLSLYLFAVSIAVLYQNRAFYSPVVLAMSNGRRVTFRQLKRSHFIPGRRKKKILT